jgi:hypothetical protein
MMQHIKLYSRICGIYFRQIPVLLSVAGLLLFYMAQLLVSIGLTAEIEKKTGSLDEEKTALVMSFVMRSDFYARYFSLMVVFYGVHLYQKGIFRNLLTSGLTRLQLLGFQLFGLALLSAAMSLLVYLLAGITGHYFGLHPAALLISPEAGLLYLRQVLLFFSMGTLALLVTGWLRSYLALILLFVYYQAEGIAASRNASDWKISLLDHLPVSSFSRITSGSDAADLPIALLYLILLLFLNGQNGKRISYPVG